MYEHVRVQHQDVLLCDSAMLDVLHKSKTYFRSPRLTRCVMHPDCRCSVPLERCCEGASYPVPASSSSFYRQMLQSVTGVELDEALQIASCCFQDACSHLGKGPRLVEEWVLDVPNI